MGKFKDITGQKFHHLTAVKLIGRKNNATYWLFECDCEDKTTTESVVYNVKAGKIKSCGCLNKHRRHLRKARPNQSEINSKVKASRLQNPEYYRKYTRKYYEKHKETILANHKQKRNDDINYRIKCRLRIRLSSLIKKGYKTGSTIDDLGCSIEKFKLWIELHWKEGMTWDNYGQYGWHLDHIKPLSSFDLTNKIQFLEAVNFKNIQPLWAYDNLSKGDRLDYTTR